PDPPDEPLHRLNVIQADIASGTSPLRRRIGPGGCLLGLGCWAWLLLGARFGCGGLLRWLGLARCLLAEELPPGGGDVTGTHLDSELVLDEALHLGQRGDRSELGQGPPDCLGLGHAFLRTCLTVCLLCHVVTPGWVIV